MAATKEQERKAYLHPTMYLLIPVEDTLILKEREIFTSHYVSINSPAPLLLSIHFYIFTSHYVSINSAPFQMPCSGISRFTSHYVSINSGIIEALYSKDEQFTSHYVSINSEQTRAKDQERKLHLHPTMYLLIPVIPINLLLLLIHLHPTMYLLIHIRLLVLCQYFHNLHPTMYLLIPPEEPDDTSG